MIPDQGDSFSGWGGDISSWIGAVTNGALYTQGGNFTLTSDVNFGGNFGLISIYFKSRTAAIANTGVLQLANSDNIVWAGTGAQGDVGLSVDTSNYVKSNTGFNAGAGKVINLATPTASTDAATKGYVDDNVAAVESALADANSALASDNAAFAVVNAAITSANTAIADANAAFVKVNAALATTNTTFGTINTDIATVYAKANAAANTVATFANGRLILAGANINFNNTATVNVSLVANGTTQTNIAFDANVTAISPSLAGIEAALASANAALGNDNAAFGVINTAMTSANSAIAAGNAAFAAVNSALAAGNSAAAAANAALASDNAAFAIINVQTAYLNVGVVTTNTNINCAHAVYQDLMLCGDINVFFQNTSTAGIATTLTLYVRQSQNGDNTITWANTIRWSDNNVPVLSTTKNTGDMFTFSTFDGGTIWFGAQVYGNVPLANVW